MQHCLPLLHTLINFNLLFSLLHDDSDLCSSVDATFNDGIGKYINDSPIPNCIVKVIEQKGKPHLCLKSLKYITEGSEFRYNYGVKAAL